MYITNFFNSNPRIRIHIRIDQKTTNDDKMSILGLISLKCVEKIINFVFITVPVFNRFLLVYGVKIAVWKSCSPIYMYMCSYVPEELIYGYMTEKKQ